MLEHLRPLYARNFRCLGSQCEDHCCRQWEVVIDRATYDRYQRLPELQPHLQEYFAPLPEGVTEKRHARIRLTASGACPFLSPENLCHLQQQYGEAYLPPVCAAYPRNPHRVDGLMEWPLSLSCIEAARLVLLNPQLMPPDANVSGPHRYDRFLAVSREPAPQNDRKFRYSWDVREFCLLLVRDRSYPLWQRLFLLGMFCKRLGEIFPSREFRFVPMVLCEYAEVLASGTLRSALEGIPARAAVQVRMVVEVAFVYLRRHTQLCRIQECLQDFLGGIGHASDPSLEACTQRYCEAYHRYYGPFMAAQPFLLENYLGNHIFRVVFPFGQNADNCFERPYQEYLMLCLEFAVMKGLLIGMAGHHREAFAQEHVVKLAQCLAKSLEHDPTLGGTLNFQGLAETECVAALLKN